MKSPNHANDRAIVAAFIWPRSYQEVCDELGLNRGAVKCATIRLVDSGHLRFAGFGTFSSRQRAMYVSTGRAVVTVNDTFDAAVLALPVITVAAIMKRFRTSTPVVSRHMRRMVEEGKVKRLSRAPALWVPT